MNKTDSCVTSPKEFIIHCLEKTIQMTETNEVNRKESDHYTLVPQSLASAEDQPTFAGFQFPT